MGAHQSVDMSSYEDVLTAIKHPGTVIVMNTLPMQKQDCLILHSISALHEETTLNGLLDKGEIEKPIIVYGLNCVDKTPYRKLEQLLSLGFSRVSVYPGGMLEWLLLQDAFGKKTFETTILCSDIMMFSPTATSS